MCAYLLCWAICVVVSSPVYAEAESPAIVPTRPLTVVIDPGHGGGDLGARGPTGLTEKMVSLKLARQLAANLEPDFRIFLTRSDDYAVELSQRAATANQSKADLLISIHTGSGFLHRTDGVGIFYYAPIKKAGIPQPTAQASGSVRKWGEAHLRHRAASIALAKSLKDALDKVDDIDERTIQGAPLKLLEGADLPAVLVEIGHITHPATETRLSTPEGTEPLGRALAEGIRNYMRGAVPPDQPPPPPVSKP